MSKSKHNKDYENNNTEAISNGVSTDASSINEHESRKGYRTSPSPSRERGLGEESLLPRVGMGYDVHQLVEGRDLWLGGIKIEHSKGLLGHSDADVLIHAICDALLGAANLRDIGYHFPDTSDDGRSGRQHPGLS